MSGTLECREGYLIEDMDKAERLMSEFTQKGFEGIHIFRGRLFSFRNVSKYDLENHTIGELTKDLIRKLKGKEGMLSSWRVISFPITI